MRGYNDFIIKTDFAFSQTFKTESGVELHGDSRFLQDRLSNRIAAVIETPIKCDNDDIKKGFQVLIDPSIFYENTYIVNGTEETPFTIDKNKGIYKLAPTMIVCYRENENAQWKGYNDSLLVVPDVIEEEEKKVGLIIIEKPKSKPSEEYATVIHSNKLLEEEGVVSGSKIFRVKGIGLSFWIEGKEHKWINNRHVLALIN